MVAFFSIFSMCVAIQGSAFSVTSTEGRNLNFAYLQNQDFSASPRNDIATQSRRRESRIGGILRPRACPVKLASACGARLFEL
jgi:hypothetical protein